MTPRNNPEENARRSRLWVIALFLLAFSQYAYTLGNPLIWDAQDAVLRDSSIHSLRNLGDHFLSVSTAPRDPGEPDLEQLPYYRPLYKIFQALEYAWFGTDPRGYHLINVVLNQAVVVSLFFVIWSLSNNLKLAGVASLLYAVNPARGEAVYWVYGGSNQLLALLVLATLLLHHNRRKHLALATTGLALLVREDAVLIPFALLSYEWAYGKRDWRRSIRETTPHFLILFVYLLVRNQVTGGMPDILSGTSLFEWSNAVAVVLQRYFSLTLLPRSAVSLYPYTPFDELTLEVVLSYGLVIAYCVALYVAGRKDRALAFWLVWPGLWISLWFNTGQFGSYLMTEKGMYLAAAGLCVVAAHGLNGIRRPYFEMLLICIVGIHFSVTLTRSFFWRDPVTFFEEAVAQAPDFTATRYQLGMKYADRGQYEQAASQFDKVIQLDPGHSMALNNLGNCHFALGNIDQATSYWSKAWEADHSNAKAAYNLGFAAEKARDIDTALHYYRIYLSLVPQPPEQIRSRIQDMEGRR